MMHRRLRLWLVPVAVVLLVLGTSIGAPNGAGAITSAQCADRVNNTAVKLVECIRTNDLWKHMRAFQAIANAHPGPDGHPSRNSGEPGYLASAIYVANLMSKWGYKVHIQTYKFPYSSYVGTPVFREVSPTAHRYALVDDWNAGLSNGTTTAALQPAGGIIIPPTPSPSSASGCAASDFSNFTAGRIALIQRGTCNYGVKVINAQAAGASGVVIFNEGNPGRTDVINGSLSDANNNPITPTIPVAFTSFAIGRNLYRQYNRAVHANTALPRINLAVKSISNPKADDYNVIADSPGGDPNHVLVVDAHLDAIYGAGMLDNASGSATILDIAHMMRNVHPRNKMRFIWFGGEELGLLGSSYYVNNLSPSALGKIGYDLDADVTATPNYDIGILDPAAPDFFGRTVTTTFPSNVYGPSKIARNQAIQYFNSNGMHHILFSPVGTDAFTFNEAGIPASGVLTGQDCCKTRHEVNLFGGYTGNYEGNIPSTDGGCVDNPFRWCDNLGNNNPAVMTFMSRAFAKMVIHMAFAHLTNTTAKANAPHAEGRGVARGNPLR